MAQSDSGIYQIRNKVNGKVYIGSSVRVEQRISTHKRHLLLNKHSNQKLQLAYNKYGIDNFEYSVLEYICDAPTPPVSGGVRLLLFKLICQSLRILREISLKQRRIYTML